MAHNTMRHIGAVFLLAGLCSACTNLTQPKSTNGTAAYAGTTLQAVEQTAATQYSNMSKSQAKAVHGYIKKAETYRNNALKAIQAGNTKTAQTNLQKLSTVMSSINNSLHTATGGQ